jgi:hypothetical protein
MVLFNANITSGVIEQHGFVSARMNGVNQPGG